jgi:hypothetical protein
MTIKKMIPQRKTGTAAAMRKSRNSFERIPILENCIEVDPAMLSCSEFCCGAIKVKNLLKICLNEISGIYHNFAENQFIVSICNQQRQPICITNLYHQFISLLKGLTMPESVWDYPRPPKLERTSKLVRVEFAGVVIAETRNTLRLLETSTRPPTTFLSKM